MAVQAAPEHAEEMLIVIQSTGKKATIIGEVTNDDKEIFGYNGKTIAVIPHKPSEADLAELRKED